MGCNPKYDALLARMQEMHDRKSQDYASDANRYSNFEFAGMLGAMFSIPADIAFAVLIGVKLARLGELKGKGKTPNNESVEDSFLDLAVYASLWASYWTSTPEKQTELLADVQKEMAREAAYQPPAHVIDVEKEIAALAAELTIVRDDNDHAHFVPGKKMGAVVDPAPIHERAGRWNDI